jgi:hypothetical protein
MCFDSRVSNELIFTVLNLSVLPAWALLWLLPRHAITRRIVHSGLYPCMLGLAYALLLFGDRPGPQGANFFTLEGVARVFTTPRTIIACWVHYLVFDLFVGAWIARDCERLAMKAWTAVPSQVLTLLFGPVGLLTWMLVRGIHKRIFGIVETDPKSAVPQSI